MRKIIAIVSIIIFILIIKENVQASEKIIPDEAIRLRVVANSNSVYDQQIKIKVRDILQRELYSLLKDTNSIENAKTLIKSDLSYLDLLVGETLDKHKYNKKHDISYGYNYFPKKTYKGVTYDEGYYESLLVTIGNGEGDNWWCVLFPPLCLLEAEEASDVEYKFFVAELINKYIK